MATNIVGFHVAANNAGRGLAEYWQALDSAGIPFAVYSAEDAGLIAAAAKHQNATLIYRDVEASTVNPADYNIAPDAAAGAYWARHIASLPPEIVALKGRVWLELLNEPGREPAQAQWVGALMVGMARRALAQGWRVMGPGWAPGNPEIEAWRYPGWVEYLELCQARPDAVAVSLHEYSLSNDIHAGENWLIGRFIHLFEACDAMGIARPTTYITEAGWTLNSAPAVEQMKNDIAWMSSLYARHPQIKSAHLWTMQGGRGNGDLPAKLSEIVPWLTDWTLRQRWPDPPPPPPPTEENMLIDLSKWNGALDAAKAKQNGISGVILRASYGVTRDEMVTEYAARLKAAGIPVIGCYHYYHPWQPWQPQLDTFVAACRAVGARRGYLDLEDMRFSQVAALEQMDDDAPPDVLRAANAAAMRNIGINPDATSADDLYEPGLEAVALSAAQPQLIEAARQFMAGLSTALPLPAGKRHGIYSNYSYIGAILGNAAWMAQYDLWVAAWTIAAAPAVPPPWQRWVLWQYSNSGDGPSYGLQSARVDLNRFNGTAAEFVEWLKVDAPPVDVPAAIRAGAAAGPGAGWHPTHALPLAIIRDGYLPIGAEFDVTAGGVAYRGLRAFDRTGKMWIYYAPVPKWNEITRIAA